METKKHQFLIRCHRAWSQVQEKLDKESKVDKLDCKEKQVDNCLDQENDTKHHMPYMKDHMPCMIMRPRYKLVECHTRWHGYVQACMIQKYARRVSHQVRHLMWKLVHFISDFTELHEAQHGSCDDPHHLDLTCYTYESYTRLHMPCIVAHVT